jgi:hypothetical protein
VPRHRRGGIALAAVLALSSSVVPLASMPVSAGGARPELRLLATRSEVRVHRFSSGFVFLDPKAYLSAHGGDFELERSRPDYDSPIVTRQRFAGGGSVTLPDDLIEGWEGLSDFLHVTLTRRDGSVRLDRTVSFCPNTWGKVRVGPDGPSLPVFPDSCGWNPFTLGFVYGIEQDWASSIAEGAFQGFYLRLKEGRYTMQIAIADRYLELFDVDPEAATVSLTVVVKDRRGREVTEPLPATDMGAPAAGVPTVRAAETAGLPDLQPLPSWGIGVRRARRGDFLTFGANVWVSGNGPLVVEGFRREGERVMDAYQYFWEDGAPVGRARVGEMEFDDRRGHEHWHFRQFAAYQLLAEDRTTVVKSTKEAFCLVPTDAIDLTLPAAELRPGNVGLWTSCGGRSDLWVREVLPVGWGDTYYQYVPGQSFNLTGVPNGTYYVKVVANPGHQLQELDYGNNVRLRKVILHGRPGRRWVEVPPWHGIDTEAQVTRYGLGPFVA